MAVSIVHLAIYDKLTIPPLESTVKKIIIFKMVDQNKKNK